MVPAIWRAVWRAARRDLGTFQSIRLNHFFLFVALMIWGALVVGQPPRSAYPFLLLLGLLMLFPMSSDPLAKAPAIRLEIWPLASRDRFRLRLASLALSPVLWFAVLLALIGKWSVAAALLVIAVAAQALIVGLERLARRRPRCNPFAFVPPLPGRLGGLAGIHVRQMLSVLDIYVAILLSAGGTAYRILAPHPDTAAFPILALLVALALSTGAQCLFGLDSAAAMTRYRLLPLRGWQILLAKDTAVIGVLLLLVLPLNVPSGLTFGLTALAIGHFPSVLKPSPQLRWRFLGGRMISGVPQIVAGFALGFAVSQGLPWILPLVAVAWLLSLQTCGHRWEHRRWER